MSCGPAHYNQIIRWYAVLELSLIVLIDTALTHTYSSLPDSLGYLGSALAFEPLRGKEEGGSPRKSWLAETWKTAADDFRVCSQQCGPGEIPRIVASSAPRQKADGVCMAGGCHWEINGSGISRNILSAGIVHLVVIR
jgi:hypothetical protein